jgi:hypothetical protein
VRVERGEGPGILRARSIECCNMAPARQRRGRSFDVACTNCGKDARIHNCPLCARPLCGQCSMVKCDKCFPPGQAFTLDLNSFTRLLKKEN